MDPELVRSIFVLILFTFFCAGIGTCKKWSYDECVKVGHSPTYCKAEAAGCFKKR